MIYILTGAYANGDEYGEAFNNIIDVSLALENIYRDAVHSIPDSERILLGSLKIESEVN